MRKKHSQRCARGLHTRRSSRPLVTPTERQPQPLDVEQEGDTVPPAASHTILEHQPQIPPFQTTDVDTDSLLPNAFLTHDDTPALDFLVAAATSQHATAHQPAESPSSAVPSYRGMSHQTASSYTASYFLHFHAFLPILHRPTFQLATCPDALASIVVAIGCVYSSSPASPPHLEGRAETGEKLWKDGVMNLRSLVRCIPLPEFPQCTADKCDLSWVRCRMI